MSSHHVPPARGPGAGTVAVSVALAVAALGLCGVPFFRPSPMLVVPAAVSSLLVLAWAAGHNAVRSPGRLAAAGLAVGLAGFALYLSLTGLHLIDWLEGF